MEFLQIIMTTVLSAAVLFGIAKLSGHKQVAQLDFFDYISGITVEAADRHDRLRRYRGGSSPAHHEAS